MTKHRFIIANLLRKVGISRKQKRLLDAAEELRLLKEAEEILGRSVWTKVKNIEQFRDHYLNIKSLIEEKSIYLNKIQEIKSKIEEIKLSQETKFKEDNTNAPNLEEHYEKQKLVIERLKSEQADISKVATNIKKSFDQSVAKLQQMMRVDGDADEISAEKAKIELLKNKFSDLKEKKVLSDETLEAETAKLTKITDSLKGAKNSYKDTAAHNYEIMGKANKAMSVYYSKIGILENKILMNYTQIGQGISNSWQTNAECKEVVKSKIMLCKIIKALRRSIDFNQILADR